MTRFGSQAFAIFLIGGYNMLANKVKSVTDESEAMLERTDGLGDSWDELTPTGKQKVSLTQDGALFDTTANRIHDLLNGQRKTSRVVCHGVEGNTIGQAATGLAGVFGMIYTKVLELDGLVKANVRYTVSGEQDEGKILHAHTQDTAAGNTEGSSVDNAASSANGGAGYVQVSQLTLGGYDDAVLKIRDSADDIVFADLITFTAVTVEPAAERLTVAGTVDRYLASSLAFSGSGSSPSITWMAMFARG